MVVESSLVPSLVGVGLLMLVATAALLAYRVPGSWAPAAAILRGTIQLALISLLLTGIITGSHLDHWDEAAAAFLIRLGTVLIPPGVYSFGRDPLDADPRRARCAAP